MFVRIAVVVQLLPSWLSSTVLTVRVLLNIISNRGTLSVPKIIEHLSAIISTTELPIPLV